MSLPNYMGCLMEFGKSVSLYYTRLGSVAGPVIQATGRSEFEDGLGSGDFVSGYSISSTKVQQHRDSQYLDG
jgi:hypothetical protein